MTNLTIFAKRAYFRKSDNHLFHGSSAIRGEQIAAFTKTKFNPANGFEKDVCIFVKPNTSMLNSNLIERCKKAYIDIVDGKTLIKFLKNKPGVSIIACSKKDYNYLSSIFPKRVVLIPQHHCNFERIKKEKSGKITTVGMIGIPGWFNLLPKNMERMLAEKGFSLLQYSGFKNRQDVVDFYLKIDLQLVWRPGPKTLSNPLKIINAASFGIPTIAYPEEAFDEVSQCYIPATTCEEVIEQAIKLRSSNEFYEIQKNNCLKKAEEYHIEKIAEKYIKLTKI